jgi:hypothetical protein
MEAGQFALHRIRMTAVLAAKLQHACVHACAALLAQVAASFFIPVCLSAAACAARLRVLCGCAMPQYVRVYNALVPIVMAFPAQRRTGSVTIVGDDVPEMIRVSWSKGLPQLEQVPLAGAGVAWAERAGQAAERWGIMQSAGLSSVSTISSGAISDCCLAKSQTVWVLFFVRKRPNNS